MTAEERRERTAAIASLCKGLPGVEEHGNAISIALGNAWDTSAEVDAAWTAAEAIQTFANARGLVIDALAAARVAEACEALHLDEEGPVSK